MPRQGFKAATTDADKIRQWWTQQPNANIGIPTGERTFAVIEGRRSAKTLSSLPGRSEARERALPDEIGLQGSEDCAHAEHGATCAGGRVDGLTQAH